MEPEEGIDYNRLLQVRLSRDMADPPRVDDFYLGDRPPGDDVDPEEESEEDEENTDVDPEEESEEDEENTEREALLVRDYMDDEDTYMKYLIEVSNDESRCTIPDDLKTSVKEFKKGFVAGCDSLIEESLVKVVEEQKRGAPGNYPFLPHPLKKNKDADDFNLLSNPSLGDFIYNLSFSAYTVIDCLSSQKYDLVEGKGSDHLVTVLKTMYPVGEEAIAQVDILTRKASGKEYVDKFCAMLDDSSHFPGVKLGSFSVLDLMGVCLGSKLNKAHCVKPLEEALENHFGPSSGVKFLAMVAFFAFYPLMHSTCADGAYYDVLAHWGQKHGHLFCCALAAYAVVYEVSIAPGCGSESPLLLFVMCVDCLF